MIINISGFLYNGDYINKNINVDEIIQYYNYCIFEINDDIINLIDIYNYTQYNEKYLYYILPNYKIIKY
jgi:hypothetical protein